jgi:hypothetical protein
VAEVTELRRWQVSELADAFVAALAPHRNKAQPAEVSPYKD